MVSNQQYDDPAAEAEFDRVANSILSNILAANPWIQRFCTRGAHLLYAKSNKANNLTERYPSFPGVDLMAINPHVRFCTHVKVNGVKCSSPALREKHFCYFHQRMIRGVPTPKRSRIHPIALIENEESIQVALMETINAVVRNHIDLPRAAIILRALNIAIRNAKRVHFDLNHGEMVRKVPEFESESEPEPLAPSPKPAAQPARPPLPETKREAAKPIIEAAIIPRKLAATVPSSANAQPAKARPLRE